MVDLLDEVQRDLKDERALRLWEKYSNHFFVLMIAVVVLYSIFVAYSENKKQEIENLGGKLYQFNNAGESISADELKKYEIIGESDYKISSLYKVEKAKNLLKSGNLEESKKIFLEVYNDQNAPIEIRDMAAIIYIDNFEDKKSSEILADISKSDRPFSLISKEKKAYELFESKDYSKSVEFLKEIKASTTASPSMVQRVSEAISYIESNFIAKDEK